MLVIDAANVIGSRPNGWWRDRPGAASRFTERVRRRVDDGTLDLPVMIVLASGIAAVERGGSWQAAPMIEVRREDGELCGFVAKRDERWAAVTVFGVVVGEWNHEHEARDDVLGRGLALLSERWTLTDATTGESQITCIQQASPDEVTLALDYYSLAGVPTLTISSGDLAAGRWTLTPDA